MWLIHVPCTCTGTLRSNYKNRLEFPFNLHFLEHQSDNVCTSSCIHTCLDSHWKWHWKWFIITCRRKQAFHHSHSLIEQDFRINRYWGHSSKAQLWHETDVCRWYDYFCLFPWQLLRWKALISGDLDVNSASIIKDNDQHKVFMKLKP